MKHRDVILHIGKDDLYGSGTGIGSALIGVVDGKYTQPAEQHGGTGPFFK
ncbi:hypothetical protein GCM10007906_42660 [Vibrio hyugaensis]|uniref:Uncharacterized protein n=1 Tax=Vibrio hyugaensis TaxID=1534743 RepID=A0ABQ5Y6U1_9VIBR|nr:hypothetical protein GCM10007906_42660 [Vibrio hyugaensis]